MLFGIHAVQRGDHRERVSKYENELIMDGIEHPVKIRDIDRFERLNGKPSSYQITVLESSSVSYVSTHVNHR